MNNENEYTPREIELLDEFAKAAMGFLIEDSPRERVASWSYDTAAAMIAERRKRVPSRMEWPKASESVKPWAAPEPDEPVARPESRVTDPAQDLIDQWDAQPGRLYPEPRVAKGVVAFLPGQSKVTPASMFGVEHISCEPNSTVAQPEPEKGELTEEEITKWNDYARHDPPDDCDGHWLSVWEIDRAVALMREGLAAKRERDKWKAKWEHTIDVPLAGLSKQLQEMTARAEKAEAINAQWAEKAKNWMASPEAAQQLSGYRELADKLAKAEAALAEAQPVLDAVVAWYVPTTSKWSSEAARTLQAYADRRREQAKGAS